MNMIARLRVLFLTVMLLLPLGAVSVMGQSVTIVKELKQVPMSSALAMYKNEFGMYEKPKLDNTFPFAVIRMHLDGDAQAVKFAKERFTLDMGQHTGVEARVTTYSNQILFLVPARRPYIYIDCGDGCDQVLLSNMQQLQSNCVYDCTVRFRPEVEPTGDADQGVKLYPFSLQVIPSDAQVIVVANGVKQEWILEDGEANLNLMEGQYRYTVTATDYITQEGTMTVDADHSDTTITLISKYGWLNVSHEDTTLTVEVQYEGRMAMKYPLPVENMRCVPGNYVLSFKKPKYLTWTDTLEIHAGDNITLTPMLVIKKKEKIKTEDAGIVPTAMRRVNTLLLAEVSIAKNPEWGVGLMFGQMYNGIGWYVKGRSNFSFQSDVTGEIVGASAIPECRSDKSSEWLMDAGMVFDFLARKEKKSNRNHFGMYAGAGYGARTRYLETVEDGWKKYLPNSYSGMSVDVGVIGSTHGFTLSAGVNTIGFKYMEIELGIGWTF